MLLRLTILATTLGMYLGTLFWTLLCLLVSVPAYLALRVQNGLTKQESIKRLIWIYGRGWVFLASMFMPVIRHKSALKSPCVIVANHASFFDVYFMGAQPEWNICMALKGWPFKIPCYSWFMKSAGYINIENMTSDEIIEKANDALSNGISLLFFPEGTRSKNGELGRFHSGAFIIALRAGVMITPLCFEGTHKLMPPGSRIIRPATITIKALDSVDTLPYRNKINGHIELKKYVKEKMISAMTM